MTTPLQRIGINIPKKLHNKILAYAEENGFSFTQSVIDLLTRGLQQIDTINAMSMLTQYNNSYVLPKSNNDDLLKEKIIDVLKNYEDFN